MITWAKEVAMSVLMGKRAVVVGAGVGGLCAARAISDHFEQVVVLERDVLPQEATPRPGAPQGRHTHVLLGGGLRALCELFPGFDQNLAEAGAVRLRAGLDILVETPGYDPFPQRDFDLITYSASRPLIELTIRKRLEHYRNILLLEGCRAEAALATPDGAAIAALTYETRDKKSETLAPNFVIDASGRGAISLDLLRATGRPLPEETAIGIDMQYATAIFAIPDDAPANFKGVIHLPSAPQSGRAAMLFPIEGNRWIVGLTGRHGDQPPLDYEGFIAFAGSLRTPTIFDAIKHARLLEPIVGYGFPGSIKRHFERLTNFPLGLLPFGDAVCRFNPVYGQGMSVAAQEATMLRDLLEGTSTKADQGAQLSASYFAGIPALLEVPWSVAALDLVYPQTTGPRPPDFERTLKFREALMRLASCDADVHRLFFEVNQLVKPAGAYRDPALQQRIMEMMAGD
jgi:2-polyprenyl-6-methoxyphenol hydroxylase-like FAD-dependent oxidoreductase